ncbi:hypothetical protein [Sandarakinorhabdus oryzae]|uniref:hypothetical protein n=1 Tax=Sandarakinorhabdus oryzae TaxID=2675220 RepID=UPI0012E2FCB1|nr:hypothetical protein [Sandarakinorhabdus oryzae]
MRRLFAPVVLAAALAGCASIDEQGANAAVDRFHRALNAGDWAAIDGLLSQSARNLRPGGATARAFRAITARHGRYLGGTAAAISTDSGRISLTWSARYERGAVAEAYVLVEEGGSLKIDSYTDHQPVMQ